MSLSKEFHKDPSFRWGDIQLLVTIYIWNHILNYSQFLIENFDFFRDTFYVILYDIIRPVSIFDQTQKNPMQFQ